MGSFWFFTSNEKYMKQTWINPLLGANLNSQPDQTLIGRHITEE